MISSCGRRVVFAAAAGRQRHGQGAGAGVPVAEDAGHRRARDARGLARAKGVAPSYVSRVLRLTLLAPEIVEAILDGRQPAELQLDDLLKGFPLEWEMQTSSFAADGWAPLCALLASRARRRLQDAEVDLCGCQTKASA